MMKIAALLTSAGINTVVCVICFSLYSILRKQPSLMSVYFGQRIAKSNSRSTDPFRFQRLVPSASWIKKAWQASEEEIFNAGGLDAVVFSRTVVFSIRIFSIAAIICIFLVLPLNYFGKDMEHKLIPDESLGVFTIENVKEGSKWLWAHCLALYVISCCTIILLYFEYKRITKLRLDHLTSSLSNPNHFTVIVRAIPWSREESYGEIVDKFFTNYYASSYLSHQMVYRSGAVQKLMSDAEKMYKMLKTTQTEQYSRSSLFRCGLCGGTATSFKILSSESESEKGRSDFGGSDLREQESPAALVFFRTRYAALVASQALQSPNPMLWVTDPSPEPGDIYWSNLCLPYRILWIRKIVILVASILFIAFFLGPVTLTQGLVHLSKLEKTFPFLKGILKSEFMRQVVTGYLPSVILMIFQYAAPPLMFFFSTVEGSISRSGRKRSACLKVLYFLIWNVFFGNILTGSVLDRLGVSLGSPKDIPSLLAKAVPNQANFFTTYVFTSGWASLSVELLQPFGILCNLFYRFILRNKDDTTYGTLTFPYHTEVPRILIFGLMGFTCSILAPLILPFLLVYYFLAYLVYRNQILNVYVTKYQSGGLYWPIVHNVTIFSLAMTQVIALGVFGLKESTVASSFTIPLIICTLLFHEYCRQRFLPVFKGTAAQVLIEMDRQDEQSGRMEEIHKKVLSAYCQFNSTLTESLHLNHKVNCKADGTVDLEDVPSGETSSRIPGSWLERAPLEINERNVK